MQANEVDNNLYLAYHTPSQEELAWETKIFDFNSGKLLKTYSFGRQLPRYFKPLFHINDKLYAMRYDFIYDFSSDKIINMFVSDKDENLQAFYQDKQLKLYVEYQNMNYPIFLQSSESINNSKDDQNFAVSDKEFLRNINITEEYLFSNFDKKGQKIILYTQEDLQRKYYILADGKIIKNFAVSSPYSTLSIFYVN